jgi:chromosome segregation ATPase
VVNENMSRPVTRGELDETLGIWAGALRAEMATRTDLKQMGHDLRAEMKQLGHDLRAEMKQLGHDLLAEMRILINGAFEMIRSDIRVLDDKVNGLDAKVTVLDTKVTAIDAKLTTVDNKYADLPPRVDALERKVSTRTKRR